MHGRDEIVVLFTISVIHERLSSRFEDHLSAESSLSLEDTRSLEEIHRVAQVAITEFGYEF